MSSPVGPLPHPVPVWCVVCGARGTLLGRPPTSTQVERTVSDPTSTDGPPGSRRRRSAATSPRRRASSAVGDHSMHPRTPRGDVRRSEILTHRPPTPDRGIRGDGRNLSTSGGFLSRPGASPRVSDSRRRPRTARHAAQPGYVTRAPTSPGDHRPGQTGVFHSHSTRTKLATGVFHSQSRDGRHGHPGYVTRDRTGVCDSRRPGETTRASHHVSPAYGHVLTRAESVNRKRAVKSEVSGAVARPDGTGARQFHVCFVRGTYPG